MPGITISYHDAQPTPELSRLLLAVRATFGNLTWHAQGVEASGPLAGELHKASDHRLLLDTERLMTLARGIHQVIDGEFMGFAEGPSPVAALCYVDSTYVDVWSDRQDMLDLLHESIPGWTPLDDQHRPPATRQ